MFDIIFGMGLGTKAKFFRQLASMVESGMPMVSAMSSMGRMRNSQVKKVMSVLAPVVAAGGSISDGLSKFPEFFEPYVIQLVKAGEVGGSLETHLNALADYLERLYDQMMDVVTRMVYPLVVFHAAIFIPPLFLLILKGPAEYAAATVIPLLYIYGTCFVMFAGYRLMGRIPGFHRLIDTIFINIPFIGGFFRARSVFRFMMVLGQLSEAGVGMELSIETASDSCGNRAAGEMLKFMAKDIQKGLSFRQAAENTGLFPHTSLEMIHTGEISGKLPFMLKKSADLLEKELDQTVRRIFIFLPVLFYLMVAAYVGYKVVTFFTQLYGPVVSP